MYTAVQLYILHPFIDAMQRSGTVRRGPSIRMRTSNSSLR